MVYASKYIRVSAFAILIVTIPFFMSAQEPGISEIITSVAEELASDDEDQSLQEIYTELLYELSSDQVIINSGDENEIGRLFFLSDFRIRILADYVRNTGPVRSFQEMSNIPGFDREITEMIIPFATLDEAKITGKKMPGFSHTLLSNIIYKGDDKPFAGVSDLKLLTRYRFLSGGFSGGVTAEKDKGEKVLYKDPLSPDFLSSYLSYSGNGIIKKIIIGDYSAKFGLGTAINTSLFTGYSLTSPGNLSGRNEIRPYTSADENSFFRGLAVSAGNKYIGLTLMLSSGKSDASLNDLSDSTGLSVRNLVRTGIHDSESTISGKDAQKESFAGINISLDIMNFRAGLTFAGSSFSLPFRPDKTDPENLFDFTGTRILTGSIYYSTLIGKMLLSGELSSCGSNSYAFIQTLSLRPADRLNVNLIFCHSSPRYISFHGRGPGAGSSNNNEESLCGSFTFEAARNLFISAGGEIRKHPWLSYRSSFPSGSKRHEISIKYLPSDRVSFEARYSQKRSSYDDPGGNGCPGVSETESGSYRVSARYSPAESLSLITRADFRLIKLSGARGVSLLQDASFRFRRIPVSMWFRYCIFNTDDYFSGIYTYENDLLYSCSIPVLYGCGTRSYLMIKYEPFSFAEARIKYGFTSDSSRDNPERSATDIRFQVIVRF